MDILTIGEVLIDLTQTGKDERGIPQFAANPGGAPANLAVAASKLEMCIRDRHHSWRYRSWRSPHP